MAGNFAAVFERSPLVLTEGAIGQRLEREYGLEPDEAIRYAALVYSEKGRAALRGLYGQYLKIAQDFDLPILLMTGTRKANREQVLRSAYCGKNVMDDWVRFLKDVAAGFACEAFVGGMLGCKGDAYSGSAGLPFEEAAAFHAWQSGAFGASTADYLFAGIMPTKEEAMGMAKAMAQTGKPYIISLMVSRGGTLLDGTPIHDAIVAIDGAAAQKPLCYMANCVHPAILQQALMRPFNRTETVAKRFWGLQANAACFEPKELDGSCELCTTSPAALADAFEALDNAFPMKILGGCCGTDDTHIWEIARRFSEKRGGRHA